MRMADVEPPSFSLGLDLESGSEPRTPTRLEQHSSAPADPTSHALFIDNGGSGPQVKDSEDEEEESTWPLVMESDLEPKPASPHPLKRLRRGPGSDESGEKKSKRDVKTVCFDDGDDDIEELSSQEGFVIVADGNTLAQFSSPFSSSKRSLHRCGFLSTHSSSLFKTKRKIQALDALAVSSSEKERSGLVFPKLTVSPLRRFQLLYSDSDSEEPSIREDVSGKAQKKIKIPKHHQSTVRDKRTKILAEKHLNEDLWKDFCQVKSFHIPTPMLDEVCDEYFQSLKGKKVAQKLASDACTKNNLQYRQNASSSSGFEQRWNLLDPVPPAHHYFFHRDPMIQKLVCSRLPNFLPLGIDSNRGNQLPTDSVIDYMCQFNEGNKKNNSEKGSTRVRNKSEKSNAKDDASEGWVDPESSNTIPKDAGKRRVVADGQAAGRWYTSPEGRKVYVSRSGQELLGRNAYGYYKKEHGRFKKSRKKTNAKKKKG